MSPPELDGPVLVTGAAGKTGQAVARRLLAAGVAVRALVRPGAPGGALPEFEGAERVEGDLRDPESLAAAASGALAVYHICPNVHPDEVAIGRAAMAAARAAGGIRFVFHSVLHPQCEAMPHHRRKLRVEELLFESGLPFTVLQPAAYMQNLLGQWESIVGDGIFRVPYGVETRIAMVDLEDVGEAAVRVLSGDDHLGATYELCAPGLLSQKEIATVLSRRLGRPVRVQSVELGEWRRQARAAGLDAGRVETLDRMFRYYDRYGMCGGSQVLGWLLGRPPTSFDRFVRRSIRGAGRRRPDR